MNERAENTGAMIRAGTNRRARQAGYLEPGQDWYGEPEIGELIAIAGFITTPVWITDARGWSVWSGMLDRYTGE